MYTRKIGYGGKTISFGGANINIDINVPALYDGSTVARYIYDSSITIDSSGVVIQWNDLTGNDHHLTNSNEIRRPILTPEGVLFDGVNDTLQSEAFTYNQPSSMYIVMNQKTWTDTDYIICNRIGGNGTVLYQYHFFPPTIVLHSGSDASDNTDLQVNTWGIVRAHVNGANSKIQINNLLATGGNAGTNNSTGIGIGGNNASLCANVCFKELIFRNCVDTPETEQQIYNYLKYKYNIDMDKLYGRELIYNGTFDTSAGWRTDATGLPDLPNSGWYISEGKLISNGTSSFAHVVNKNLILQTGATYMFSCDVDISSGLVCTYFNNANNDNIILDNGHNEFIFTYAGKDTVFISWETFVGSIDNVSVRQYFG